MKEIQKWIGKIAKAEKKFENYHKLIDEIREYYKNEKRNNNNIFWSSVETLKPFLYFKQPKPYIERKEKKNNQIESTACKILERALDWDLAQFDFDGVIKYVRNDFLLSGLGICYEKYTPTFKKIKSTSVSVDENGVAFESEIEAEILDTEKVETVYIDPKDLIFDSNKVGIWEDCLWVARKINMTSKEVIQQFGEKFKKYLIFEEKDENKDNVVYQIFDKNKKQIIYLTKNCPEFLRVDDDLFKVDGFYPFPKPIFATTTNDCLIPIPDYSEIKPLLDELNGVTDRMERIMKAFKVTGVYDNSFSKLGDILSKDTTLVSISDFDTVREVGGLKGLLDFMPLDQYINALQVLSQRKEEIVNSIYEITGVSDIMRGNSNPDETATAVMKKTNFGTLRNQDRQNDMQRFITDLLKIKADMICEQFSTEMLLTFAREENPEIVMQAIELLRSDKTRGMIFGIETDTSFMESGESEKTTEAVKLLNDMITNAFQTVSAQPILLPLYKQMVESIVITLPNARQYENIIENTFAQIEQQLNTPQEEQPNIELEKIKLEREKLQLKAEEMKQTNALKVQQMQIDLLKIQNERQKDSEDSILKNKEMEIQKGLKEAELITNVNVGNNIPTGYVRGFE